jgi:alcohol dehydrogenase YqhD (iron-dependent ADH family)
MSDILKNMELRYKGIKEQIKYTKESMEVLEKSSPPDVIKKNTKILKQFYDKLDRELKTLEGEIEEEKLSIAAEEETDNDSGQS